MNHRFHVGEKVWLCYTGDGIWRRSIIHSIRREGGQQRYVVTDYLGGGNVTIGRDQIRPLEIVDQLAELDT